ncbi:hypothetical protein GWK47_021856 [Chionoecetes opilio]|uniref:Uncharacterized protein n=1 Tax=Chionoecetes opilio TaxID=41210 RepID=A0A8J4XNU5_CHIOP|nr:hypothetical protein GWK47_021856 [Chionoecetes opilio]
MINYLSLTKPTPSRVTHPTYAHPFSVKKPASDSTYCPNTQDFPLAGGGSGRARRGGVAGAWDEGATGRGASGGKMGGKQRGVDKYGQDVLVLTPRGCGAACLWFVVTVPGGRASHPLPYSLGVASMNTAQPAPQAAFRHFRVSRCAWKSCSEYYFRSSPLGSLYIIQGTLLTPSDLLATCRRGPGHFSPPPPLSVISGRRHWQAAACSEQDNAGPWEVPAWLWLLLSPWKWLPSIFSLPHTSIAVIAANRFMMTDG